MEKKTYFVLAYYHFAPIQDPHQEVLEHKKFFEKRDVASRIYISEEGINGQMSAFKDDAIAYMEWMSTREPFQNMPFKIHEHHEQVFPRKTVKYRKQLVALDRPVDIAKTADHLSPKEWKKMLEESKTHVLVDVRNDYESKIGHFEGAECPSLATFREFNAYADELVSRCDPKETPVMMYCTGGIRCELYSVVLKDKGFEKVYQLDGGIINYGLQLGNDHWKGKLFVFDDRLAVPLAKEGLTVISECSHCKKPNDTYYNCANMDCNELFLCCTECAKEFAGCCCSECMTAPRVRQYHQDMAHKPFRRKGLLQSQ